MDIAYKTIVVNGVALNVADAGAGEPVLLLHGFPDTHAVWRLQIPVLVQAGYRVIAPDTRGCGDSQLMPRTSDYHMRHLLADLKGVLDALGIDKVKLASHDWGSVIGWQFAMAYPQRVERFITLSVGHPNAYARGGWRQKLKGYYVLLFQLRGLAECLLRLGGWRVFAALTGYPDEVPHWRRSLSRPGRLAAGINYYRANLAMVLPRDYPRLAVPVTGIYSDGDRFLTECQMQASAAYCDAGFTYHRLEGANHWMQLHAPGQLNPLLLKALQS